MAAVCSLLAGSGAALLPPRGLQAPAAPPACPAAPPQVVIARDALDSYFWLNLLLTLLAWLPGALHAIWVVLERPEEEGGPLTRPFLPKGGTLV